MKKNNYQIKRNLPPLSSEQIARHQNFDALLAQFEQEKTEPRRPVLLRRIFVIGGAIAAAIVGLVFILTLDFGTTVSIEAYAAAEKVYFEQQPFIQPPIKAIKPTHASYTVNVNQGGVYEYQSGSRLVVPVAAFMNDRGELIEGEVSLYYRELHDQIDFFLSGIPMVYDSAGVKYNLESAGMVEIYAEQNGQRVRMAPGKTIDVELVSTIDVPNLNVPPKYNIYKLDTVQRNWVYQDVDKIQMIEDFNVATEGLDTDEQSPIVAAQRTYRQRLTALAQLEQQQLSQIEATIPVPQEPLKPQKPDASLPTFELNNTNDANPEFANVIWQLSPNNPPLNENAAKVNWEESRIKKINAREYEITFVKGTTELKILAIPVLEGSNYERAMAAFEQEFAAYEKQLAEREAKLKAEKDALAQRIATEKAAAQQEYDNQLADLRARGLNFAATDLMMKRKVVNRFQANSFGIWNCDRPIPPMVYQIQADFVDETGKHYTAHTGYLVDKSRNTVYRFYATDDTPLQFNMNSENILWLMTEDNKIAVFYPENFKTLKQQKGSQILQLDLIEEPMTREEDVRRVLKI